MKKLCLTFAFFILAASLLPATAYSATSKKKKHSKKTTAKTHVRKHSSEAQVTEPVETVQRNHGIPRQKLADAYDYGKELYKAQQYDKAKEIFRKLILASTDSDLNANSLYIYSQCAFRTDDFTGCVKAMTILAKRWPNCPIIKTGYPEKFCVSLINDESNVQTGWDYMRFVSRYDENGRPVWKESIPPGFKLKRINFKLGFGLYQVLNILDPNSQVVNVAKQRLDYMINAPITMVWVDEKAPPTRYGHPPDFFSIFSINEKKDFSKIICQRMFYDFQTEKLYQFLDMYDDVRNLKPRFVARTKPPEEAQPVPVQTTIPTTGNQVLMPNITKANAITPELNDPLRVLTLSKLFKIAGYDPYNDSYTNVIETSPTDLNL
jgi:tetratricopeptide (TPR) repeat protein